MFDLDHAIAEWRIAFERDAAFARHEIDDLEAHLRDSIAERIAAGERLSQAFEAARAALGTPGTLKDDFRHVGAWHKGLGQALRVVAVSGLVLYVSFFMAQSFMGSIEVGWIREAWRTGFASASHALRLANVFVYLGALYVLLGPHGTRYTRRMGTISIALWCMSTGIFAYALWLTAEVKIIGLIGINSLVLIGLASLASYRAQWPKIGYAVALACIVGFLLELSRILVLGDFIGSNAIATLGIAFPALAANGLVAWVAWQQWTSSSVGHQVA